jgi:hypothetical protein
MTLILPDDRALTRPIIRGRVSEVAYHLMCKVMIARARTNQREEP